MDDTGLSELLGVENAFGDKGYLGTGITVPYRKPAGGELLDWQKEFNTTINKIRYVIERTISHFKTWRCMHTDYRRPKRAYVTAFEAVRALHFFRLSLHKPHGVPLLGLIGSQPQRRPTDLAPRLIP